MSDIKPFATRSRKNVAMVSEATRAMANGGSRAMEDLQATKQRLATEFQANCITISGLRPNDKNRAYLVKRNGDIANELSAIKAEISIIRTANPSYNCSMTDIYNAIESLRRDVAVVKAMISKEMQIH